MEWFEVEVAMLGRRVTHHINILFVLLLVKVHETSLTILFKLFLPFVFTFSPFHLFPKPLFVPSSQSRLKL